MIEGERMGWIPRGLEKVTLDRWIAVRDHRVIDEFMCSYSIRGRICGEYGPEYKCQKVTGHSGDHKWFMSDKHGDYDLWYNNHRYDYQLEEI
jgi:hypothetical protein